MTEQSAKGLEFPCDYPIKAMGRADAGLKEKVSAIVAEHAALDPDQVRTRPSSAGRFESITITVRVESREQLETIYSRLAQSEQVLWTL